MHTKSPLLVAGSADGSSLGPHPFEGLPADMLAYVYTLPDGESLAGTGGLIQYFNHFLMWEGPLTKTSASGWTLSAVTGTATITQPNTRSGEIAITADATGSCNPTLQQGGTSAPAPFFYTVGKRMWCFARLKMLTVASTEFFFGFGTPDTQPTVTNTLPADGIFFSKATAETKLGFEVRKASTSTKKSLIGSTLADATYITVGFMVDKLGNVNPYMNGSLVSAGMIVAGSANLPNTASNPMQFMLGFLGASQVVTLDWLWIAQEN